MNAKQAKTILEALEQGEDPATRDLLPKDSGFDKPSVIHALLALVVALDSIEYRFLMQSTFQLQRQSASTIARRGDAVLSRVALRTA